jgi:hypothetical protein
MPNFSAQQGDEFQYNPGQALYPAWAKKYN